MDAAAAAACSLDRAGCRHPSASRALALMPCVYGKICIVQGPTAKSRSRCSIAGNTQLSQSGRLD
jgi:hypothetical protein